MYFLDQTLLDSHMTNKRLSAEMSIETAEGTYTIHMPNLVAQAPANSAEGENQDYKTKLTLTAEEGSVMIGASSTPCAIAVIYVPKP
ncbi:hypothetical protein D9M70_514590 [compost metagenome]